MGDHVSLIFVLYRKSGKKLDFRYRLWKTDFQILNLYTPKTFFKWTFIQIIPKTCRMKVGKCGFSLLDEKNASSWAVQAALSSRVTDLCAWSTVHILPLPVNRLVPLRTGEGIGLFEQAESWNKTKLSIFFRITIISESDKFFFYSFWRFNFSESVFGNLIVNSLMTVRTNWEEIKPSAHVIVSWCGKRICGLHPKLEKYGLQSALNPSSPFLIFIAEIRLYLIKLTNKCASFYCQKIIFL